VWLTWAACCGAGGTLALKEVNLAARKNRKRKLGAKPEGNTSVYVTVGTVCFRKLSEVPTSNCIVVALRAYQRQWVT
jgi:Fe-S oxidoreductase